MTDTCLQLTLHVKRIKEFLEEEKTVSYVPF